MKPYEFGKEIPVRALPNPHREGAYSSSAPTAIAVPGGRQADRVVPVGGERGAHLHVAVARMAVGVGPLGRQATRVRSLDGRCGRLPVADSWGFYPEEQPIEDECHKVRLVSVYTGSSARREDRITPKPQNPMRCFFGVRVASISST